MVLRVLATPWGPDDDGLTSLPRINMHLINRRNSQCSVVTKLPWITNQGGMHMSVGMHIIDGLKLWNVHEQHPCTKKMSKQCNRQFIELNSSQWYAAGYGFNADGHRLYDRAT